MTAYVEMFSSIIKRQHCFTRGFVLSEQNPKRLVYSVFVKLEVELELKFTLQKQNSNVKMIYNYTDKRNHL